MWDNIHCGIRYDVYDGVKGGYDSVRKFVTTMYETMFVMVYEMVVMIYIKNSVRDKAVDGGRWWLMVDIYGVRDCGYDSAS